MTALDTMNSVVQTLPDSASDKGLRDAERMRKSESENPFLQRTEDEFLASVDRGIYEADHDLGQDAFEAIQEISRVLKLD